MTPHQRHPSFLVNYFDLLYYNISIKTAYSLPSLIISIKQDTDFFKQKTPTSNAHHSSTRDTTELHRDSGKDQQCWGGLSLIYNIPGLAVKTVASQSKIIFSTLPPCTGTIQNPFFFKVLSILSDTLPHSFPFADWRDNLQTNTCTQAKSQFQQW